MNATTIPDTACAACGARLSGVFCSACGQSVLSTNHTLTGLARDAVTRLFNLEHGLAYTARRLSIQAGGVIRDYLAGRTSAYTHPFAYLLLAFAGFALSARFSGASSGSDSRVVAAFLIVFLAGASRVVFWRSGLNYAEHLILNMYLLAHTTVILTLAQLGIGLVLDLAQVSVVMRAVLATTAVGVGCSYFLWGYSRVFSYRPVLSAGGGLLSLALAILMWLLSLSAILA